MKVKVYNTRTLLPDTEISGTQLENGAVTLDFDFPEIIEFDGVEYKTSELTKTIDFRTPNGDFSKPIFDDKYTLTTAETQSPTIDIQVILSKIIGEEGKAVSKVWASSIATINLGERINATGEIPPLEEITIIEMLIAQVEQLSVDVQDLIKEIQRKLDEGEFIGPPGPPGTNGGGVSDLLWLPTVDTEGNISFERSSTTIPPEPQNIKGPSGKDGIDGENFDPADVLRIDTLETNVSNLQAEATVKWVLLNDVDNRTRANTIDITNLQATIGILNTALQSRLDGVI